jgi:mannose-1-phosphate guanylyltransferase
MMNAMVLAAGLGTRLRPYSEHLPKPLFPVLGVTALEWAVRRVHRAGAKGAVVNTHYLAGQVAEFLDSAELPIPVRISHEPDLLGTGGGVAAARQFLEGGAFILHNSDAFVGCDLSHLVRAFNSKRPAAMLMLTRDPNRPKAHVVGVRPGTDRIVSLTARPDDGLERWIYTGISIFSRKIFDFLPLSGPSCLVKNGLIPLIESGETVLAHYLEGPFIDIGTIEGLVAANRTALKMAPQVFSDCGLDLPVVMEKQAVSMVDVPSGTKLVPPVFIANGTSVTPGIRIGPEVFINAATGITQSIEHEMLLPGGQKISIDS